VISELYGRKEALGHSSNGLKIAGHMSRREDMIDDVTPQVKL
jgi:hypothetical protein